MSLRPRRVNGQTICPFFRCVSSSFGSRCSLSSSSSFLAASTRLYDTCISPSLAAAGSHTGDCGE
eukprot:1719703-Prymnesium_polylepis.1